MIYMENDIELRDKCLGPVLVPGMVLLLKSSWPGSCMLLLEGVPLFGFVMGSEY